MSRPIFRVGLSALSAYCGISETSPKRKAVHRRVVRDRQLGAVEHDAPGDMAHPPVETDEALGERRLAAAGLARQPGDLAVRDLEGDAVDRLHVAVERPIADLQVLDRKAHVRRSLGLKISSRPTFVT